MKRQRTTSKEPGGRPQRQLQWGQPVQGRIKQFEVAKTAEFRGELVRRQPTSSSVHRKEGRSWAADGMQDGQASVGNLAQKNGNGGDRTTVTSSKLAVRETYCKTILNRTSISDYSLNCYTGCSHGCIYCYARFMQRFHPHPEPWGEFVDVKVNAIEVLLRQLRRLQPGEVFVSSVCDGWQPIEAECKLTRRCCDLLLKRGFRVNVLTKSSLLLRDLELFAGRNVRVGVTVTTLNEELRRLWEPKSSPVQERLQVIEQARQAELKTAIMFGPLLPYLSDNQASINSMFQRAAGLRLDVIWVDTLNPRPRVWPSVARLIGHKFPALDNLYRKILFDYRSRAQYLSQLRGRVALAAKKFYLADRITLCF